MKTHFVCVLIHRRSPANGELEFLVMGSRSTHPKTGQRGVLQVKFPGGTNREYPGEPVEMTRDREVWEETRLAFLRSREIWRREVARGHTQVAFLVDFEDCRGELRKTPTVDANTRLAPPRWSSAATLGRVLHYSHQGPYLAACRELGVAWTANPYQPPVR